MTRRTVLITGASAGIGAACARLLAMNGYDVAIGYRSDRGGAGGAIVNISSAASRIASPNQYVEYAASKAAIDTLTKGLAEETAADGIRVNAIRPGLIETEIHAKGGAPGRIARLAPVIPMQRAGTAEEVAQAALWLLSDAAS